MASGPTASWQIEGRKVQVGDRFPLPGLWNHCQWWLQPWNQMIASWQERDDKLDGVLKSRDITLLTKVHIVKAMVGLPSGHVQLWKLDHKEGGEPKNWCLWTMVLEKTHESPLDSKEIKPVKLKGNHPEYSLEGLMLKLKLQYFGHLMSTADSLEKSNDWEN